MEELFQDLKYKLLEESVRSFTKRLKNNFNRIITDCNEALISIDSIIQHDEEDLLSINNYSNIREEQFDIKEKVAEIDCVMVHLHFQILSLEMFIKSLENKSLQEYADVDGSLF